MGVCSFRKVLRQGTRSAREARARSTSGRRTRYRFAMRAPYGNGFRRIESLVTGYEVAVRPSRTAGACILSFDDERSH
jgi:hypothetical protein